VQIYVTLGGPAHVWLIWPPHGRVASHPTINALHALLSP